MENSWKCQKSNSKHGTLWFRDQFHVAKHIISYLDSSDCFELNFIVQSNTEVSIDIIRVGSEYQTSPNYSFLTWVEIPILNMSDPAFKVTNLS